MVVLLRTSTKKPFGFQYVGTRILKLLRDFGQAGHRTQNYQHSDKTGPLETFGKKRVGRMAYPPMDEIAAFTFIDDVNSQVRSFVDRSSFRPVRDVRLETANARGAQTGGVDRGGYKVETNGQ